MRKVEQEEEKEKRVAGRRKREESRERGGQRTERIRVGGEQSRASEVAEV